MLYTFLIYCIEKLSIKLLYLENIICTCFQCLYRQVLYRQPVLSTPQDPCCPQTSDRRQRNLLVVLTWIY